MILKITQPGHVFLIRLVMQFLPGCVRCISNIFTQTELIFHMYSISVNKHYWKMFQFGS